ncbi:hypothetical protein F0L68_01940 [Solihabitans fulvus]|uniref:Uncharacterized protein n=1 Tax=Solihabitans fulvus TaxID=1892852 RepID=A0A5B2XSU5_9PSEU|nr:bacteriophage holin [Solihabitans fulvus]KAA2266526.1 hypothetical protein F0L68_01940 [Solihabitans fulvus]
MPYLPTVLLVALGVLLLVLIALRTVRAVRRFNGVRTMVARRMDDQAGLLRARSAALGVAFAERRSGRGSRVGSREPAGRRE